MPRVNSLEDRFNEQKAVISRETARIRQSLIQTLGPSLSASSLSGTPPWRGPQPTLANLSGEAGVEISANVAAALTGSDEKPASARSLASTAAAPSVHSVETAASPSNASAGGGGGGGGEVGSSLSPSEERVKIGIRKRKSTVVVVEETPQERVFNGMRRWLRVNKVDAQVQNRIQTRARAGKQEHAYTHTHTHIHTYTHTLTHTHTHTHTRRHTHTHTPKTHRKYSYTYARIGCRYTGG